MGTEPTVFIVDDDEAIRRAVGMLLQSVGLKAESYASAEGFLHDYDPSKPGCLVLDVRMPVVSGLALQETLIAQGVDIPIIFLTGHGDVPTSVRAMKAHAMDFIQKPINDQDLLDKIYEAIEQDAETRRQKANTADITTHIASLTPREQEIMRMIVDGKPSKVIAIELNISEKTVQTHRTRIMKKVGAKSLAALIKMVLKVGMD